MEAKTYLQVSLSKIPPQQASLPRVLASFYSQSFSHSMVIELFRYWRRSEFQRDYENVKNNCIFFRDEDYSIRIDMDNPATGISLPLPKTLDDFIRDCERAGILLFWKEEISKMYFQ